MNNVDAYYLTQLDEWVRHDQRILMIHDPLAWYGIQAVTEWRAAHQIQEQFPLQFYLDCRLGSVLSVHKAIRELFPSVKGRTITDLISQIGDLPILLILDHIETGLPNKNILMVVRDCLMLPMTRCILLGQSETDPNTLLRLCALYGTVEWLHIPVLSEEEQITFLAQWIARRRDPSSIGGNLFNILYCARELGGSPLAQAILIITHLLRWMDASHKRPTGPDIDMIFRSLSPDPVIRLCGHADIHLHQLFIALECSIKESKTNDRSITLQTLYRQYINRTTECDIYPKSRAWMLNQITEWSNQGLILIRKHSDGYQKGVHTYITLINQVLLNKILLHITKEHKNRNIK